MTSAAGSRDCPVITTERLTLRPHGPGDFADSLALWADPAVVRYIGGAPSSPEEAWSRLLRYAGLWRLLGFGYWRLGETASGRFVGEAGLAEFKRTMVPDLAGAPEAGWALAPWAHGRGYASEAMRAILAWADKTLEAKRTVCMIEPENLASIRLSQRLGYQEFDRRYYKNRRSILLQREIRKNEEAIYLPLTER
ncbi:MAG: GNAT family N-acetyltransferase [Caulobacteraceae bacterium]|nr:GNAT family N-acetyltransferase [Caulobacteraceae bacterium]